LRFILSAGQAHDCTTAAELLADRPTAGVIADKAYDTNELRQFIDEAGAEAVIPSKRNRKVHIPHDKIAYRLRNRIERFFNKLKNARRVATRYDKTADSFLAFVQLASIKIWLRFVNRS
jgi:transposase